MGIPFYADRQQMSKTRRGTSKGWLVTILYLVCVMTTAMTLNYFDGVGSRLFKALAAIVVIGVPVLIIHKVKNDIWKGGDEALKNTYLKHTANYGVSCMFILITWQLWGRWIVYDKIWENLAIAIAPYLMMTMIYSAVRKDMKN